MRYDFGSENGNTVRRRLRLAEPAEGTALAERIGAVEGVKWLEIHGTDLCLAYDFTLLDYDAVRRELEDGGFEVEESGLARLRAAWYRFTDANARDNTRVNPACCSRPPPGAGHRRR